MLRVLETVFQNVRAVEGLGHLDAHAASASASAAAAFGLVCGLELVEVHEVGIFVLLRLRHGRHLHMSMERGKYYTSTCMSMCANVTA
jgi:hypothetical protein